jgi:hypothetical protein
MKTICTCLLAVSLLVIYSCSKDKDDTPPPPTAVGYTAKIDDLNYVGAHARTRVDSPDTWIKIGKNIKLISNMGNDKAIAIGIELKNNKLEPGTYPLAPRADKTHVATLQYVEKLDQPQPVNYASYYVPKDQDGQVVINTVTDSSIIGTFRGKVLAVFGQTTDSFKVVTEGKIYIKF